MMPDFCSPPINCLLSMATTWIVTEISAGPKALEPEEFYPKKGQGGKPFPESLFGLKGLWS